MGPNYCNWGPIIGDSHPKPYPGGPGNPKITRILNWSVLACCIPVVEHMWPPRWHGSRSYCQGIAGGIRGSYNFIQIPSRPVLPFCPFWLHTCICLNSPELHCWLSSHPHCIKMLGLCFRVYVRRSQGAGTDPAKDSMPRACRRGQGLPSDLPKDSLCLHLVVIDCKFVVRKVFGMTLPKTACPGHAIELNTLKYPILFALRKGTDFLQTQWVMCMALPHMWNKKKGALFKPWPPRN